MCDNSNLVLSISLFIKTRRKGNTHTGIKITYFTYILKLGSSLFIANDGGYFKLDCNVCMCVDIDL